MKVIFTVGYGEQWRADVMDLDLRPLRSTWRTQRPTLVCRTGRGILRVACEVLPRSISVCPWMGAHLRIAAWEER